MIKDGVSMGESVRMSAGDGQSVIYTGAGGRVGGIMSLEVVLLVLMIFGSVIVEAGRMKLIVEIPISFPSLYISVISRVQRH